MENTFLEKTNVFEFVVQKVTNFCSKKKNEKKYCFYKNKFGKKFFYKKQIGKYLFGKNNLEIFFSLFNSRGRAAIIRQIRECVNIDMDTGEQYLKFKVTEIQILI